MKRTRRNSLDDNLGLTTLIFFACLVWAAILADTFITF